MWLSPSFRKRLVLTGDNSSAAGATADFQGAIPAKDNLEFWDDIDTSGNELRVTAADGITPVTYDIDNNSGGAFNKTTKDGRISIDGATVPTTPNSMVAFWLYYNTASTQGDASSAVTIASPRALYVDTGLPPEMNRHPYRRPQAYATRTPDTKHKYTFENDECWISLRDALRGRRGAMRHFEEPWYATMGVLDEAGVSVASQFAIGDMRFVTNERERDEVWLVAKVKAGTSATVRTALVQLYTTRPPATGTTLAIHRQIEMRIGFKTQNIFLTA